MSLSARDQRILTEIARDLAATNGQRHPGTWVGAFLASLLAGIALLMAGLALHIPALACAGAVMTQVSAAGIGYVCARACRSRPVRLRGP